MTERKRASHFALMDTAFAADRKFVRLARKATIPVEYAAAVGVFWLLLADARRSKSPEIDWADYEEYQPQIQLLQEVGLLGVDGFPPGPFEKWAPVYRSPADTRRYAEVRKGTQGNASQRDISSIQFTSVPSEGGAGGNEQGLWAGKGSHTGQHSDCLPCAPMRKPA